MKGERFTLASGRPVRFFVENVGEFGVRDVLHSPIFLVWRGEVDAAVQTARDSFPRPSRYR